MDVNTFLDKLVKNKANYVLTPEDKKIITHEGIGQYVFRKINSSKYRSTATSPDYLQKVIDKIDLVVGHQVPLYVSLPFGATKNPYLPTAPGIDWAEVFSLDLLRRYLSPIAAGYEPGVILHFVSVGVFEEKVNRIPQKDVDLYDKQFVKLIKLFSKHLPKNMKILYSRVGDEISQHEINRLLEIKMDQLKKEWHKQPQEVRDYKIERARRNSLFDPKNPNQNSLILDSALGHDAFCSECWTRETAPWDKKEMVTLGYTYTSGWAIHVRSAAGSTINFWSGMGVLEKRDDGYLPVVYSPKQYQQNKTKIRNVLVDVFGETLSNLQKVPVLNYS